MLSCHCLWRSGRHRSARFLTTRNGATCLRNEGFLAPRSKGIAQYGLVLRLSNDWRTRRWFSHIPPAQATKPENLLEDEVLDERTPRETSALLTPAKPSSLDLSSPHYSLQSFQAHAVRTGLSTTSTVYTGTSYEYLTKSTLQPYGLDLHRVGGRGDRGVDLIGIWGIPILTSAGTWKEKSDSRSQDGTQISNELEGYETQSLKVLVQCKRLVGKSAKIGPNLIRELDGAVRGVRSAALFDLVFPQHAEGSAMPVQDDKIDTSIDEAAQQQTQSMGPAIGVLVSTKPATKGVVDSMRRSSRGLVWIMMEELQEQASEPVIEDEEDQVASELPSQDMESDPLLYPEVASDDTAPTSSVPNLRGRIKQILWNQAARDLGLEGIDVVKRYDGSGREEVVLMRGDRVWGGS